MNIEDVCDADFAERYAHYEKQYGEVGYSVICDAAVHEMLDEIHVMLRELLKQVPTTLQSDLEKKS